MAQFDRVTLGRQAKEFDFVRDTFEKVCRLSDALRVFEQDELLSEALALKGGTAINLTIFPLPRLSVDIDLDFTHDLPREEMLAQRKQITDRLGKYMVASGYALSPKSKTYHALDSFVYEYTNAGGMKDNLKIEINYMLRAHILPLTRRAVDLPWLERELTVLTVAPLEIFASKLVALMNRAAPRDLYDVHNMQRFGLFDETETPLLRKCFLFYAAIGSETVPEGVRFDDVRRLTQNRIKTDLAPVLRGKEFFVLKDAQEAVLPYLEDILAPEPQELAFWDAFRRQEYRPELLFSAPDILSRISQHPMAMWKCNSHT